MTEPVIALAGVEKAYRFFKLTDVTLRLEAGQIMGLVGANGAGKSTTIRMLMGMVRQDRGDIRVLGHSMPREQAAAKRDIGFVSEDMRLHGSATLAWHMRFVASIYPDWDAAYAESLARRFNAAPRSDDQGALARRARQGHAAARARPSSAPAAARRADHRTRSRRASRGARRADGRHPRRAPRHPVLVAQHAGRRADLRRDHVSRSRPDHRLLRQGNVPRSLAPPSPRSVAAERHYFRSSRAPSTRTSTAASPSSPRRPTRRRSTPRANAPARSSATSSA